MYKENLCLIEKNVAGVSSYESFYVSTKYRGVPNIFTPIPLHDVRAAGILRWVIATP